MEQLSPEQARQALGLVADARREVASEVGLPRAYWWAMGAGWAVLGVINQFASLWLTGAATLAFGAAHASVAARLLDGRRRTHRLQVSREVAGSRVAEVVIAILVVAVAVTVALALGLSADGARHSAIWAGAIAGLGLAAGGPMILSSTMRILRR